MKVVLIVAAVVAAFVAGSVATAATGWKVFATATDKGQYSTYASADAKVQQPNGLAVRATGKVDSVNWYLSCDFSKKPAGAGLYVVSVATADSCTLNGSAFGPGGTTGLQLLRR